MEQEKDPEPPNTTSANVPHPSPALSIPSTSWPPPFALTPQVTHSEMRPLPPGAEAEKGGAGPGKAVQWPVGPEGCSACVCLLPALSHGQPYACRTTTAPYTGVAL